MLMQNHKTPDELGITPRDHAALTSVLGMLERGELKHRDLSLRDLMTGRHSSDAFNMSAWSSCILGHAMRLDPEAFPKVRKAVASGDVIGGAVVAGILDARLEYTNLGRLAFPDVHNRIGLSTEQAAIALRAYLTTGVPEWPAKPELPKDVYTANVNGITISFREVDMSARVPQTVNFTTSATWVTPAPELVDA